MSQANSDTITLATPLKFYGQIAKTYYALTKPGIIYGNLLTAAAGFLLAAQGRVNFQLFIATLIGTSLVIASACVFNNYIDRDIDKKMARTKQRALVTGSVSGWRALIYATVLGALGFYILAHYVNVLTVWVGLVAFIFYVVLYGIGKRRSVHGTIVGSVAGAAPIVAGYSAATNRLDSGAVILFLILTFWQMPHFYSIAIYRSKDYAAAGLPVLPVKKSVRAAKIQILAYIVAFGLAISALTVKHITGYSYLLVMGSLTMYWFWLGLKGFKLRDSNAWARKMFGFSLLIILALSVVLACNQILP